MSAASDSNVTRTRDLDPEDVPKIVSVDDHIIEPPDVWTARIPSKYADVMPRSVRMRGTMNFVGGVFSFEETDDGDEADWWQYEDGRFPLTRLECAVGFDRSEVTVGGITYGYTLESPEALAERLAADVNARAFIVSATPAGATPTAGEVWTVSVNTAGAIVTAAYAAVDGDTQDGVIAALARALNAVGGATFTASTNGASLILANAAAALP